MKADIKVFWLLVRSCTKTVWDTPTLLVLPFVSFLLMHLVNPVMSYYRLGFGGSIAFGAIDEVMQWGKDHQVWMMGVGLVSLWWSLYMSVAAMLAVRQRFQEGRVNVGKSLAQVWKYNGRVLSWIVVMIGASYLWYAPIYFLEALMRSAAPRLDAWIRIALQIVNYSAGFFWEIGGLVVLPILVYEDLTWVNAFRRMGSMMQRRWGWVISGLILCSMALRGMTHIQSAVLFLVEWVLFLPPEWYGALHLWVMEIFQSFFWNWLRQGAYLILGSLVQSVFWAVMYMYVVEGVVPEPVTGDQVDEKWEIIPSSARPR